MENHPLVFCRKDRGELMGGTLYSVQGGKSLKLSYSIQELLSQTLVWKYFDWMTTWASEKKRKKVLVKVTHFWRKSHSICPAGQMVTVRTWDTPVRKTLMSPMCTRLITWQILWFKQDNEDTGCHPKLFTKPANGWGKVGSGGPTWNSTDRLHHGEAMGDSQPQQHLLWKSALILQFSLCILLRDVRTEFSLPKYVHPGVLQVG